MAKDKYAQSLPGDEVVTGVTVYQDYYVEPPVTTTPTAVTTSPDDLEQAATGIDRDITVLQAGDPIPYVFGRTMITPQIITAHVDGDYLYVDYLVSYGECNAFISLIQNGNNIGTPSPNFEYFYGTSGQSASTLMSGVLGSYDALPNICHFVAKLEAADSLDFGVIVEGIKTFDPRTSPQAYAYNTNPALAFAYVMTACGYTMDWDSVAEVANYCDEDVSGSSRWTLNLPVLTRQNISVWISAFSQYAHCLVDIDGSGYVRLIPDAPVTASPSIARVVTADNIVAGTARTKKVGLRDVPEQVTVSYRQEEGTQRLASAGSGDIGRRSRLTLPGIQTYTEAKRHATELLNKTQADLRHEHIAHDTALKDAIGDLHQITYAPHGLSAKVMRLITLQEVEPGRWKRGYIEYDAGLYSDAVFTAPTVTDTDLPNPNTPPDGPTPTAVEQLYTDETGTTYSRLKITFTGVDWPYTQAYKISCEGEQNVLNTLIAHEGQSTHTVYTAALKQGVLYTVSVYVQSNTGALSEVPGQTTATAAGKLLPPGDVPSLNAYEAGNLVAMSWGAAEEIDGDLRGYAIKRLPSVDYTGTSADWSNANAVTIADRVDATTFLTAAQPAGDWYYGVKAIDNAGNVSENARWQLVSVTDSAVSVNVTQLSYGSLTNMHVFTIDGDAIYVITAQSSMVWDDVLGGVSPITTWADAFTSSPVVRWGDNIATDSEFQTDIWDIGSEKTGNWVLDTTNFTLFGGTQSTVIALGDNSSPIVFTNHSGSSVNANGQNFKGIVSTTDSPASPGDGLLVKLPIQASFGGNIIDLSGTAVIAATSPLDNPKAVTFSTSYSSVPEIQLTIKGSTPKIAAYDNLTTTGMDIYLWDLSGNLIDGEVDWTAEGA